MTNLVKDVSAGKNPPDEINVVVDIPKGESNKYEYKEEGYVELDRVLYSPFFYPVEYGFIPQSAGEDGDPLDVLLLTTYKTFPGCVIKARPLGMLVMSDEEGVDNKILAAPMPKVDPRFSELKDINDVNSHLKKEIEHFFQEMKRLEVEKFKFVKVEGWKGINEAKEIIKKAVAKYGNPNK